jgi:hypothetical protein
LPTEQIWSSLPSAPMFCGKCKSGQCRWSQPESAVNDGFSI